MIFDKKFIFNEKFFFLVYGVLIVLSCFGFESMIYVPFYLAFAFFIGWLWFFGRKEEKKELRLNCWLIVIPLIIIFIARIIPFFSSSAPLGYDTGIYKKTIENFSAALPSLPHFSKNAWGSSEPWGLYLSTDILSLVGASSSQILYGYYILLNLLLGLSIYALVKVFFNRSAAILSVFVFALSLTQFQAYWMMYYKNIAGLFLMLMAFYLLKRKSWLAIPVAGFLGGLHRPTFLIFGLAMFSHFIFNKDKKYNFISGIVILFIAFSLYIHNFQAIFQFLSPDLHKLIKTFGYGTGSGTFFNFVFYRQIITFYLPFAVLGLFYLIKRRQFNYLFFYFILNFAIVYFGLIFHNRFIVHLDVIVIILSGIAIDYILARFMLTMIGRVAVYVFLIGAVYILGTVVLNKKPLISKAELTEIELLPTFVRKDDYVMATDPYYSPWIYGYSNRKTIAPGLFEYNKWNREEWSAFWFGRDPRLRYILMSKYHHPVYIFVGDRQYPIDFSGDSRFIKISKRVWKYEP